MWCVQYKRKMLVKEFVRWLDMSRRDWNGRIKWTNNRRPGLFRTLFWLLNKLIKMISVNRFYVKTHDIVSYYYRPDFLKLNFFIFKKKIWINEGLNLREKKIGQINDGASLWKTTYACYMHQIRKGWDERRGVYVIFYLYGKVSIIFPNRANALLVLQLTDDDCQPMVVDWKQPTEKLNGIGKWIIMSSLLF